MNNNKIVFGITAILLIGLAVFVLYRKKNNSSEGFGMLPSFTWKVDRVAATDSVEAQKGNFFSVPGTYQSMLAPRMSGGVDYGANINYRLPDLKNLAVPEDPLTYDKMVKEDFDIDTNNCAKALANSRSSSIATGLARAAIDNGMPDIVNQYPEATDLLPVGDMTTINAMGEESQPIVYDRFVYANRNSRLRSQGDMIRGDLPIVPCSKGWFQVSVQPNIDLQAGAMNVLAGQNNEVTQSLSKLINITSGGADTAIAGANLGNQFATTLGAGQTDVTISAYP
jgi:hypothetical protein